MKFLIASLLAVSASLTAMAHTNEDTISINFGNNSKIVIYLSGKDDLQLLQKYDINKMVKDLQRSIDSLNGQDVQRLVIRDSTGSEYLKDAEAEFQPEESQSGEFQPEEFQKEIAIGSFSHLSVGDNFQVSVKKGEAYKLILDGKKQDVDAVEISPSGDKLALGFPRSVVKRGKVKVYIETPELNALDIHGAAVVNATGFESQELKIDISGAAKGQAVVVAGKLVLEASGASRMRLIGKTDELNIQASGAAEIDASRMETGSVKATAGGASKVLLHSGSANNSTSTTGVAKIIVTRGVPQVEEERIIRIKIGKYEFSAPLDVWEEFENEIENAESVEDWIGKAKKEEYLQDETPAIRHWVNIDFGLNNYLESGEFPDAAGAQYAVRPWGSWYVGVNSSHKFHIGGPVFLEWNKGVSWYNFKFDDEYTRLSVQENGIGFIKDQSPVDGIKSKLAVSHLNMSLVPVFDFSNGLRKVKSYSVDGFNFKQYNKRGFRVGLGGYAGYRIGSHVKYVFKDDRREKEKDRGSFFLNNWRYGVRAQVGFKALDLFFNYDLSPLYIGAASPDLNSFSFGVTF